MAIKAEIVTFLNRTETTSSSREQCARGAVKDKVCPPDGPSGKHRLEGHSSRKKEYTMKRSSSIPQVRDKSYSIGSQASADSMEDIFRGITIAFIGELVWSLTTRNRVESISSSKEQRTSSCLSEGLS
jgi:hypothetical protein